MKTFISVLMVAGILLVMAGSPRVHAQGSGSLPSTPNKPTGNAIWVGMVDLEWNEIPGADSYDVQYFNMSGWVDLPGDGISIAFYGAGAVVSGLNPSRSYTFRVRAVNSHGASGWSAWGWIPQTDRLAAWVDVPEPVNVPATGAPRFNGSLTVGEVLTVDTSSISDENGLDRVKFYYQWISSDGTTDTDIAGATGSSYTFTEADEGKTLKVRVWFTDRHGFAEDLVYDPTINVAATGVPIINGTLEVRRRLSADTSAISDANGLDGVAFSYQWVGNDGSSDTDLEGATNSTYTLLAADLGKTIKVRVTFTDDAGNEETLTSVATVKVQAGSNRLATGLATISGLPEVSQTLRCRLRALGTKTA